MNERFKIYVDRLTHGEVEKVTEAFSPDFLGIEENDLVFGDPVNVSGEAYTVGDRLILHLTLGTIGKVPCSICNEPVNVDIKIEGLYHDEPLENIKTGVFDYSEVLRGAILLQTPDFAECHQGNCPERNEKEKFFRKTDVKEGEESYQPFKDLKLGD